MTTLLVVLLGLCTFVVTQSSDVFRDVIRFQGLPLKEKESESAKLLPKKFFIRNNLKGDVEFRESKNMSVEVFLSGRKEDRKRFRVHYQMLNNKSVVDLQVFLEPEPPNWPLIGGLAGAGLFLFVLVITVLCVVYKRHKERKIKEEMLDQEKFEKGKNVLEKRRWWMGSRRRRTTTSGSTVDEKKKARQNIQLELENVLDGEDKVKEKLRWWRGSKRRRITTSGSTADEKKKAQEKIKLELENIRGRENKVKDKANAFEVRKEGSDLENIKRSPDNGGSGSENIKTSPDNKGSGSENIHKSPEKKDSAGSENIKTSPENKISGPENIKSSPEKKDIYLTRKPNAFLNVSLILMSIIAVTMATQLVTPQARIVIHVPSSMVVSNSRIFFNERYQGRLIVSSDWKGDVKVFKQFAVSQAFSAVAALDSCSNRCEYACDPLTKSCICYRGYKMAAKKCEDIDECATSLHSCHTKSTCNNTIGSYRCTCPEGMWGDGVTCKKCTTTRTPCPENFYQSSKCTRIRDRICKACSPKCEKTTYQQYGCGLSFDRKCVDISRPLSRAKRNITDIIKIRSGAKVIIPTTILMENRLHVQSTNASFIAKEDRSFNFTLHRNSGFLVDVEVFDTHLIPMYKDYDGRRGSNNPNITLKTGFNEMRSRYCRHPAPDYYELAHKLHRERQTLVESATCKQTNINLCPENTEVGEKYHYRVINEPCRLATTDKVCKNSLECDLQESSDTLYCTRYVSILGDLFDVAEETFMETPVYVFDSKACKAAFLSCYQCRNNNCGKCDRESRKNRCSCCYIDCLQPCDYFYALNCSSKRLQNVCAKGDVSEFKLTPKYSHNLKLQFNCYLEHDPPKSLYTLRYRVRYEDGTIFTSGWISKTVKHAQSKKFLAKGMNMLDSLRVSYDSEKIREYFLKAKRSNFKEDFRYSVAEMNTKRASFIPSTTIKKIQPLRPFSLQIGDGTWNSRATCRKLSYWSSMLGNDFSKFTTPRIRHLGMTNDGAFGYEVADPGSPPSMSVQISNEESILKHLHNTSSIVNDDTFKSSIRRKENSWVISLEGKLSHCPSVVGLSVIDELDGVKVIESDLLILCPRKKFEAEVDIPRQGKEDRERLFSVFLSDSQQEYKLQVALVDKLSRKQKVTFRKTEKDTKRGPFMILMPLFVTTGFVLLALIALLVYAQKTAKKQSKMELASASGWVWVEDSRKEKDKNRLKRRHVILVVFVVIVRLVYSLVFTFSVALAILILLHADNMKIINDYRSFVQRKGQESKYMSLRMDQFREKEIKASVDQSADIQRACDHSLGIQLKWLQYNMSCTLQSNHMKMFNKISQRVIDRVTDDVEQLERQVKEKVRSFSESTKHKISSLKLKVEHYGRRVYDNKWFSFPKVAYNLRNKRKKREIPGGKLQISEHLQQWQKQSNSQIEGALKILSRKRRSFSGSKFIGFLDFIGVLDQRQVISLEKSINDRLNSLEESLKGFKQVMASGTPPTLPLSTAFLCPLRYLTKEAKKDIERGIKQGLGEICDATKNGIQKDIHCFSLNISSFCAEKDGDDVLGGDKKLDSSSQRVYFEKKTGIDSTQNTSSANKSSIIKSSDGQSHYNVEKGDALEEQIDSQKEESLKRQGKLKEQSNVYKNEAFSSVKQTIVYVLGTIDALLFVFRCLKTYQIVMKLLYGFEETTEHNVYEFQSPTKKQKIADILGRIFDIFAKAFTKFIAIIKNLQKKVFRTNIVPLTIVLVIGAAVFYLIIFLSLNVMNVTVIEELGGYRLISARLDSDFEFTNAAIADHIKYLNEHDMKLYKKSVSKTLRQYNDMLKNFNNAQTQRFKKFNEQICSISKDKCIPLMPDFPKVSFSSCIIGRIEAPKFDDYKGTQYRYKLKFESKKYVDAARNIFLDTLYFILAVVLSFGVIIIFSTIVFYFLKSRDMVRIKYIHVYPTLPPEILKEYGLEDMNDLPVRNEMKNSTDSINRVKIPDKFVQNSKENSMERQNSSNKSLGSNTLTRT